MTWSTTRIGQTSRGASHVGGRLDVVLTVLLCCLMADFLRYLGTEWVVLKGAPLIFLTALAVFCGLAYAASKWRHGSTIESLNERIKLGDAHLKFRDDQLEDLKEKVGTTSPNEIKERIDGLEAQLAAIRPRRLSTEQTSKLVAALGGRPESVRVAIEDGVDDAYLYAEDLKAAFRRAEWKAEGQTTRVDSDRSPVGLTLCVPDPSALTSEQKRIAAAMRAAGLRFDVQAEAGKAPWRASDAGLAAEILVSRRMDS